jgi:hypothetical protein
MKTYKDGLLEAAKVAQNTVCDVHLPTGVKIYGQVAARVIRALAAQEAAQPDGWVSVPMEPNESDASDVADGYENLTGADVCHIYRAMLDAALKEKK